MELQRFLQVVSSTLKMENEITELSVSGQMQRFLHLKFTVLLASNQLLLRSSHLVGQKLV